MRQPPDQDPSSLPSGLSAIAPSPGLSRTLLAVDRALALVPNAIRTHLWRLFFVNWASGRGKYIGQQVAGCALLLLCVYPPLLVLHAVGAASLGAVAVMAAVPLVWAVSVSWASWFSALDEEAAMAMAASTQNLSSANRKHLARIIDDRGTIRFMDAYRIASILSSQDREPREDVAVPLSLLERMADTPLGPLISAKRLNQSTAVAPESNKAEARL